MGKRTLRPSAIVGIVLGICATGRPAHAVLDQDALACQAAVGKALLAFEKETLKAWQKCLDATLKGRGCDPGARDAAVASAITRARYAVSVKCPSAALLFDAPPTGIGFARDCHLEGGTLEPTEQTCFDRPVSSAQDLVDCLVCWKQGELDEWLKLVYPCLQDRVPAGSALECGTPPASCPGPSAGGTLACLGGIGRSGTSWLLGREKTLERCELAVRAGRLEPPCPDATTAAKLARLAQQTRQAIARKCPTLPPWWDACPEHADDAPCAPITSVADVSDCVVGAGQSIADELVCAQYPGAGSCPATTTTTSTPATTTTPTTTTSTTSPAVQCCRPTSAGGAFLNCDVESAAACANGGTSPGPGTCSPNPCTGSTFTSTTATSTSSTSTPASSTTTTTSPPTSLILTSLPGTSNCGGAGLTRHCSNDAPGTDGVGGCAADADCGATASPGTCTGGPPPSAPFSGELDAASGAKIVDLGLGCFYLGGGHDNTIAGLALAGSGSTTFSLAGSGPTFTVGGSAGTGRKDCSLGAGPGRHCIGPTNFGAACTTDATCDSTRSGSCAPDPNCFFGAPLSLSAFNACVLNVFSADASGSLDETTGTTALTAPLSFRVYLAACPVCSGGTCSGGQNAGAGCTPEDANGFSADCLPPNTGYFTSIPLTLPLVTASSSLPASGTSPTGSFCPSQVHPGAFGQSFARRVLETGTPPGDLSDRMPHMATLAASFCVGDAGSLVNSAADLPGPGGGSVLGTLRVE